MKVEQRQITQKKSVFNSNLSPSSDIYTVTITTMHHASGHFTFTRGNIYYCLSKSKVKDMVEKFTPRPKDPESQFFFQELESKSDLIRDTAFE